MKRNKIKYRQINLLLNSSTIFIYRWKKRRELRNPITDYALYDKLNSLRAACMIVSFTAQNTSLMFSVSAFHIISLFQTSQFSLM